MTNLPEAALTRGETRHTIDVADETLIFRQVPIGDLTPTGAQLAAAAGFKPGQVATVLHLLANGELEDIRPDEVVELRHTDGRFVIVMSDRLYRVLINGERFDWPCRIISGAVIRKLGRIGADLGVFLELVDAPDRLIGAHDLVDLDAAGVEAFSSRTLTWKLNVQGVVLNVQKPTIGVREALTKAGFNANQGWHIFLKIVGQPKRAVELTDTVNLTTPGIEKLRLTPREVNNGEAPPAVRRLFDLLDADERHLAALGVKWETVIDGERRWLLIYDYPLPVGYKANRVLLALEVPPTYPGAQIYGFYAYPPLALASGREIPSTQLRGVIDGRQFHGWSRNRGSTPWSPALDNIASQLALVDAALAKEVGE